MAKSSAPQVVELSTAQLEALLVKLAGALPAETYQLVETLLRTLQWVTGALEAKNTSLGRLRRMLFGAKTETTRNLLPPSGAATQTPKPKAKGHGRKAAQDYPGAKHLPVPHPKLHLGDLCPKCLKGKLYLLKTPARIVRIAAQPIFNATVFELERLRCALCGTLFTAPAPPEAGPGKYDPSCGVMLNLQRFGVGQPMYRTDKWQNHFGVPLAASTQWQLMAAAAKTPEVVYEALIQVAAQAELLHNDDTPMRVQSLRREMAASQDPDPRTGIFTTGIIAQIGPLSAALFFTGRNHAGENLNQLLKRRAADLAKPMQMCDALSRNEPKDFQPLLPAVDAGTDLTLTAATHTTQAFVLLSNSAGRIISIPNGLSKSKRSLRNTRRSKTNFKHFRAKPFQPMPDRITLQSYTARIIAAPCGVISGSPRCGQWFCRQVHPHDRRQKVVRSPALPWLPPALRRHCFAGVNRQTRIA